MLNVVNRAPGKPGGSSLAVGRATSAFGRQPSALLSFWYWKENWASAFFISLRKPGVHVPRHVMAWHGRHIVTCGTSPEQEGYHQGIGNYHEFLKDVGWLRICSNCLSTLMVALNYGDHRRILYHRPDTPPWCIFHLYCFSRHRLSSILISFSRLPLSIWLIIEIKAHTFKL